MLRRGLDASGPAAKILTIGTKTVERALAEPGGQQPLASFTPLLVLFGLLHPLHRLLNTPAILDALKDLMKEPILTLDLIFAFMFGNKVEGKDKAKATKAKTKKTKALAKAKGDREPAAKRTSLLTKGKRLCITLVYYAEEWAREKLGVQGNAASVIKILNNTLQQALVKVKLPPCFLTQTDKAQQAHLVPAQVEDGYKVKITTALHLTGDLPCDEAQQQLYLGNPAAVKTPRRRCSFSSTYDAPATPRCQPPRRCKDDSATSQPRLFKLFTDATATLLPPPPPPSQRLPTFRLLTRLASG